jgi:hypothetical protein
LPRHRATDEHRPWVVEADSASQDTCREFNARSGWPVSVAGTVRGALALLESEPRCLILSKPVYSPEIWTEPCRVCQGSGRTASREADGEGCECLIRFWLI